MAVIPGLGEQTLLVACGSLGLQMSGNGNSSSCFENGNAARSFEKAWAFSVRLPCHSLMWMFLGRMGTLRVPKRFTWADVLTSLRLEMAFTETLDYIAMVAWHQDVVIAQR